ncbi:hypothetical protein AURDEDRAFT_188288 [Auricularia subglabra TFB-10046 SS5]|nr:hypothetical protein AURDEDRAFT_188288 [Auricularia subglabra TFB-10046 SS5]
MGALPHSSRLRPNISAAVVCLGPRNGDQLDGSPGSSPEHGGGALDDAMDLDGGPDEYAQAADSSQRIVDAFMEMSRSNFFFGSSSHNWSQRRARTQYNWFAQRDDLADAYLAFTHSAKASGAPQPTVYPEYTVPAEDLKTRTRGSIHLVDISGVYRVPFSVFPPSQHTNVALLRTGYLGSAPVRPSIAFSVRTLLLFERLRVRARTGKHNFARVLCDLHNITFTRTFRNRLADAIDASLAIRRHVDALVDAKLGRGGDWRITDGCMACSYRCVGEEPLTFARQFALDGNNSMKRFITSGMTVEAPFPCRYMKTREDVDQFKNETQRQRSRTAESSGEAEYHDSECTDRWKNARPESEKTASWDALDETGVFVCLCRHGFIVMATDMWRSGELAKYPLSIVKSLIDLFGHEGKLEVGYDIGCAHSTTARNSSFGADVERLVRFVVGSFHGYAHNRLCQLRFHPRYVVGSGREDFEGCERLFSVNNFIAALIQHATRAHRHELMEAAFAVWDSEKYASIGSLLLAKYQDAKAKICEHQDEETQRQQDPRYSDDYMRSLLSDERDYLAGKTSDQADVDAELARDYSAALKRWWKACADKEKIGVPFIQYGAADTSNTRKWLGAQRRVLNCENDLQAYEARLGIEAHERWTENSDAYVAALSSKKLRTYNDALDALERCVVDRLAVLAKLNQRGTGYKLRKEIARGATRRGAALTTALQSYNDAARALDPPGQTISREEVFDIAFLSDFPVLRPDVAGRPWAQRPMRQTITAWAETARAREEHVRIRVECTRVRAWIRDEERLHDEYVANLERSTVLRDRLLAKELDRRAQLLFQVHTGILEDLRRLDEADGLPEPRMPGLRPVQHPDAARAVRAPTRQMRPPLPTETLSPGAQVNQAADEMDTMELSDSSRAPSELDELEGQNLDGLFSAVQEIYI